MATRFADDLTIGALEGAGESFSRRRAAVASRIEIAALEQALARGIDNLTVEDISTAAGVSRRSFYRYFSTISEALCAAMRRSLQRTARLLLARPAAENIFVALLAVAHDVHPDDEELAERRLVHRLAEREPAAWWRTTFAGGLSNSEGLERVILARMTATGEDVSRAPLITALYLGAIKAAGRFNVERGAFGIDPALLESSLRDLSDYMDRSLRG